MFKILNTYLFRDEVQFSLSLNNQNPVVSPSALRRASVQRSGEHGQHAHLSSSASFEHCWRMDRLLQACN